MKQAVLFLCPHNAAKSVMAAAYFNQFAHEKGLQSIALQSTEQVGTDRP